MEETGSRIEEALHDRRCLVEVLNAARVALNTVEAEVEMARVAPIGPRLADLVCASGRFLFSI